MGRLHAIVTMHRPQLGEGKRAWRRSSMQADWANTSTS